MDIARERMEDQGMSASQIQSAEEMTAMFMNPGMQFVIVVIMSVIFNFLLGLIVSAVVKREKPVFE
jgi:3-methyladenine DNA glycosylase Mpg